MKTLQPRHTSRHSQGFSLVEMLATIAVIGVLVAICVLTLSNIFDSSKYNAYKRNAQNIASLQASAMAAGADFSTDTSKETVIEKMLIGVAGKGALASTTFRIGDIPTEELAGAKSYLQFNDQSKLLIYTGATTPGH